MADIDCIFCKIVAGDIPATRIFENDQMVAFDDIRPQAPVHFLVIPKKHISTLDDLSPDDTAVVGDMLYRASQLSRDKGIAERGYRQIINCKDDGGQEVNHLHIHIMGGRPMGKMG